MKTRIRRVLLAALLLSAAAWAQMSDADALALLQTTAAHYRQANYRLDGSFEATVAGSKWKAVQRSMQGPSSLNSEMARPGETWRLSDPRDADEAAPPTKLQKVSTPNANDWRQIDQNVAGARWLGREKLKLGSEMIDCELLLVDYKRAAGVERQYFWISAARRVVVKRQWSVDEAGRTVVYQLNGATGL